MRGGVHGTIFEDDDNRSITPPWSRRPHRRSRSWRVHVRATTRAGRTRTPNTPNKTRRTERRPHSAVRTFGVGRCRASATKLRRAPPLGRRTQRRAPNDAVAVPSTPTYGHHCASGLGGQYSAGRVGGAVQRRRVARLATALVSSAGRGRRVRRVGGGTVLSVGEACEQAIRCRLELCWIAVQPGEELARQSSPGRPRSGTRTG